MLPSDKERLRELLLTACEKAEDGRCDEALSAIRSELEQRHRSVYLLALEYQVEQLKEFLRNEPQTEMQRLDILDSFPGLIEKASEYPDVTADNLLPAAAALPAEQEAARRWLTSQYLQHAYRYLILKQLDRALVEVRRVYILDPDNQLARNLEGRIASMASPDGNHEQLPQA